MTFSYTYRSSDGQRHAAEIEAESRDAAFARLRTEFGIRPIRVVAADSQRDGNDGRDAKDSGHKIVAYVLSVVFILLAAGGGAWWLATRRVGNNAPYQVMTPQGPVTYSVAQPLPRQMIPGDRERIENGKLRIENDDRGRAGAPRTPQTRMGNDGNKGGTGVFRFAAEAYLALFAEPGRPVEVNGDGDVSLPSQSSRPSQLSQLSQMSQEELAADFKACLKEPIRIASNDFTEIVDLKRIVTGMKLEMRAYLAAGGTVAQYLAELAKRQKLEVSYRENAERKLNEMLAAAENAVNNGVKGDKGLNGVNGLNGVKGLNIDNGDPVSSTASAKEIPYPQPPQQAAYAYWLKANAQLQSMGIYPLPLPDALRMYQMGLELE